MLFRSDHGWDYLPTLPIAAVLALVVGVLVGFPALRVKGLYLALVTLGLATLFPDIVKRFFDPSGQGQVTVRSRLLRAPEWWPAGIGDRYQWAYVMTLVLTIVAFVLAAVVVRLRFGRALVAVRDHEAASATLRSAFVRNVPCGARRLVSEPLSSAWDFPTARRSGERVRR